MTFKSVNNIFQQNQANENNRISATALFGNIRTIEWKLLVFLLLFLNVKIVIKVAAICLIYIMQPDFKFGIRLKASRLPLFYMIMVGIGLMGWLLSEPAFDLKYSLVVGTGILLWGFCFLAMHQVKLSVEHTDPGIIHRTIIVFFVINAILSVAVYLGIIIETGHINPYRYQGNFQKYFIGTGDYIKGITMDTCTTNAVLNAFGVIYFLYRKNYLFVILSMVVLLLTGSNIINLILVASLVYVFIFRSNKAQKSMIVICLLLLVIFLTKISPQNNTYVTATWEKIWHTKNNIPKSVVQNVRITERPDSTLNETEKKQKIAQQYLDSINTAILATVKKIMDVTASDFVIGKPEIPKDNIHAPSFQRRNDTTAVEKELIAFIQQRRAELPLATAKKNVFVLPGKVIAWQQTIRYFMRYPSQLLIGTGIGNFSSKLAFKATALKITGGYPAKWGYINKAFEYNHLDLYLYYFTSKNDLHSMINNSNSTYDQLLSEYGLAGLFAFFFSYIGFFVKKIKRKSYAVPLLLFMLGALLMEYWFDQLSVIVFFELLLFLDSKETTVTPGNDNK